MHFSSLFSYGQHFKIRYSVYTSFPPNQLLLGIDYYILVLEEPSLGNEWRCRDPCVSTSSRHWEQAEVGPHAESWKITRHGKLFSWLQPDVNAKSDAIFSISMKLLCETQLPQAKCVGKGEFLGTSIGSSLLCARHCVMTLVTLHRRLGKINTN